MANPEGVPLVYQNLRFHSDGTPKPFSTVHSPRTAAGTAQTIFSQIGSLVMSYHKALSSRAYLLQICSEHPTEHEPITAIVRGNRPDGTCISVNGRLLRAATATFGVGRFLNQRLQRTLPHATTLRKGEITVLEHLHAPLLMLPKEISDQLGAAGFKYTSGPARHNMNADKCVSTQFPFSTKIRGILTPAPDSQFGLCVLVDSKSKTMGTLTCPHGNPVAPQLLRNLLVMDIIRRGGFHGLTGPEQNHVTTDYFYYDKNTLYTEAMAFNGVIRVLRQLVDQYNFHLSIDYASALSKTVAKMRATSFQQLIKFGRLQARLVEPLYHAGSLLKTMPPYFFITPREIDRFYALLCVVFSDESTSIVSEKHDMLTQHHSKREFTGVIIATILIVIETLLMGLDAGRSRRPLHSSAGALRILRQENGLTGLANILSQKPGISSEALCTTALPTLWQAAIAAKRRIDKADVARRWLDAVDEARIFVEI